MIFTRNKKVSIKRQIRAIKKLLKENPNNQVLLNMLEGLTSFEN